MAYLNQQYDPAWAEFQTSYKASHPLVQTDAERADQAKSDAFFQSVSDPSSPNYRHYVSNAQTAFPGVQQWIQQNIDYDKAMAAAFQTQYGHSPILSSTIVVPPITPPSTTSVPDWRTTPGTQAPTPHQGAWNAGDVWDMNRAPADVVESMKQYAATHDANYYRSQIPIPAGQLLPGTPAVTPPAIAYPTMGLDPNAAIGSIDSPAITPPPTDPAQSIAPVTSPPNPQPAAVTPPATSQLNFGPLVTPPSVTSNPLQAFTLGAGTPAAGSMTFPDLLKQTQRRWGFGSPTRR